MPRSVVPFCVFENGAVNVESTGERFDSKGIRRNFL